MDYSHTNVYKSEAEKSGEQNDVVTWCQSTVMKQLLNAGEQISSQPVDSVCMLLSHFSRVRLCATP